MVLTDLEVKRDDARLALTIAEQNNARAREEPSQNISPQREIEKGMDPAQAVGDAMQAFALAREEFAALEAAEGAARWNLNKAEQELQSADPLLFGASAAQKRLQATLKDRQLAINQGLWMRLDPTVWSARLQGSAFEGQRLAEVLDPTPVAVAGTYLGFRWHFPRTDEGRKHEASFLSAHVSTRSIDDDKAEGPSGLESDSILLPTGGVFAEAVLGDANAVELIDRTRFSDWSNHLPPIRPTGISPLKMQEDQPVEMPTAAAAPESEIKLSPLAFAQLASGIPGIAGALSNRNLFEDMSGAKAAAELASAAVKLSHAGATDAARIAGENSKSLLDLQESAADAALAAEGVPPAGDAAEPDADDDAAKDAAKPDGDTKDEGGSAEGESAGEDPTTLSGSGSPSETEDGDPNANASDAPDGGTDKNGNVGPNSPASANRPAPPTGKSK
jgi:hypothetical protein